MSEAYHNRARWYSPEAGRFLTRDPFGYLGGVNQYLHRDIGIPKEFENMRTHHGNPNKSNSGWALCGPHETGGARWFHGYRWGICEFIALNIFLSLSLSLSIGTMGSVLGGVEQDETQDWHKDAPSQISFEGNLAGRGSLLTTMEEISPHFKLWDAPEGIVVTNIPEGPHPSPSSVVIDEFEFLRMRLDGYFIEESPSDVESFEGIMREMLKKHDPAWVHRSVLVVAFNKGDKVQVYATLWETGWSLEPVIESRSRPLTIAEALASIVMKEGKEFHEDGWGEPLGGLEEPTYK